MRFNPYGNEDMGTDIDSGGRQKGFSHGLIEGMLVRRGIDRQNKFDKLNEQHNTKLMEMQEQDSRDRVLHAALTADKMRIDNQFAPDKAQADIAQSNSATRFHDVQTEFYPDKARADIAQSKASTGASIASAEHSRAQTETENLTRPAKNNKLIAEAVKARRADRFEPTENQVHFYAENPDQYFGLAPKSRQAVDLAALEINVALPKRAEVSSFKPTQGKDDVRKMVTSAFGKIEQGKLEDYEKQEMLANLQRDYPEHVEKVETGETQGWSDTPVVRYKLKSAPTTPAAGQKTGAASSDPWAKYK
jgi:hypothetical protein